MQEAHALSVAAERLVAACAVACVASGGGLRSVRTSTSEERVSADDVYLSGHVEGVLKALAPEAWSAAAPALEEVDIAVGEEGHLNGEQMWRPGACELGELLRPFGNLTRLRLPMNCVIDDVDPGAAIAASLPKLRSVGFTMSSGGAAAALAALPLEELYLREAMDEGMPELSHAVEQLAEGPAARSLRSLRVLTLWAEATCPAGVFGRLTALERLAVDRDLQLPEETARGDVAALGGAARLRSLALALAEVRPEAACGLADALRAMPVLKEARLAICAPPAPARARPAERSADPSSSPPPGPEEQAAFALVAAAGRGALRSLSLGLRAPPGPELAAALLALPPACAVTLRLLHAPAPAALAPYAALAPLGPRLRLEGAGEAVSSKVAAARAATALRRALPEADVRLRHPEGE